MSNKKRSRKPTNASDTSANGRAASKQALIEAQAYFAEFVPEGISLVDELLEERRSESMKHRVDVSRSV